MNVRILLALCALGVALSACNTMEGMGHDIRNAGEGMSDAASKTKEKINGQ